MATDEATEATKHIEAQEEAQAAKADANLLAAQVEGEEAMRIARINHPEVDWQADPVTGAPLVPGASAFETPSNVQYNPPPAHPDEEEVEEAPAPKAKNGKG